MKKTFVHEVIDKLQATQQSISDLVFLLPSKRAGLHLKEILKDSYRDQTLWLPLIQSVDEFITERSGLQPIDNTTALFEFYHTYLNTQMDSEKEDFSTFSIWARTLINDFNEIDRYLIAQDRFFNYLTQIQDLNHWYLQPDKTPLVDKYIAFWKNLEDYYTTFTTKLVAKGKGYQGLQYRIAAQKIATHAAHTDRHYIFIGFNALNGAEQVIIQQLLAVKKAQIFWDMDTVFSKDQAHDASLFLRRYLQKWPYFRSEKPQWLGSNFEKAKNIRIIGTPKHIGQAKYMGELLADFDQEALHNTAIVLGDESLLLPVLNSLPDNVKELNITMGLPLRQVPMAAFFELLLRMYVQQDVQGNYHKLVLELLQNQTAYLLLGATGAVLAQRISENNDIYLTTSQLQKYDPKANPALLSLLFEAPSTAMEAIDRFQQIISLLKEALDKENRVLELEYCYRFYTMVNQLQVLQEHYDYLTNVVALQKLYQELLDSETLDFRGEPFRGLQLMGMLESRCLDFENVIISDVNEGVLPAGKRSNSFIPYDLKRAYQLPTYKEKDAIYAYHFYRLLHRAKNIYLLYNTAADGLNTGEKSRFLLQLDIEKQAAHQLQHIVVSPKVPQLQPSPIVFSKNKSSLSKLKSLAAHGFSPSALTTYIQNPLSFYYRYILGITEEEQVEETIAANTLGTVVHNVLENCYQPFVGKELSRPAVLAMRSSIEDQVQQEFRKVYKKMNIQYGKNLIIYEVAKRYILNFLNQEAEVLRSGAVLKIIAIESELKTPIYLPQIDFPIFLRGKVDRVDQLNGQLRIIDYKTGKVTANDLILSDWSLLTTDHKYNKAFQVLTYVYLRCANQSSGPSMAMTGGVISFKNQKSGLLQFGIQPNPKSRTKDYDITQETLNFYLEELKKILLEICNSDHPFVEKEV